METKKMGMMEAKKLGIYAPDYRPLPTRLAAGPIYGWRLFDGIVADGGAASAKETAAYMDLDLHRLKTDHWYFLTYPKGYAYWQAYGPFASEAEATAAYHLHSESAAS